MSGEGTGGTPRRPIALRLLISMGTAVLVVFVASRVNRPTRIRVLEEPPRRVDEILPEVRLNTRSAQDLVDSINRVAKEKLRVDVPALAQLPRNDDVPNPLPLHNVRLGTAVALGLRPWAFLRVHHSTMIVKDVESSDAPIEGRLYDVRDILAEADRWERPLWREEPAPPDTAGAQYFSFGTAPPQYTSVNALQIATLMQSLVLDRPNSSVASPYNASALDGWIYVRATADDHRNIELLLMLLRRGESENAIQIGARR